MTFLVAVITVSDRAAAGEYADESGPVAVRLLTTAGFINTKLTVVPDDESAIEQAIRAAHRDGARAIITTGGTGIGPRDITPEVTRRLSSKEIPGLVEQIRHRGLQNSDHAGLSRAIAAVLYEDGLDPAFIINAPGSPGGVRDTIAVIGPLLRHIIGQLDGDKHD